MRKLNWLQMRNGAWVSENCNGMRVAFYEILPRGKQWIINRILHLDVKNPHDAIWPYFDNVANAQAECERDAVEIEKLWQIRQKWVDMECPA